MKYNIFYFIMGLRLTDVAKELDVTNIITIKVATSREISLPLTLGCTTFSVSYFSRPGSN